MTIQRARGAAAASVLLAAAGCYAAISHRPASAALAAQVSIVQKLMSRYRALKSLQATVTGKTVLQPSNGSKPNVIDSTMTVSYKAPNLLHIDSQGLGGGTIICDGKSLYTYSALANQYSVSPAPRNTIDVFIGFGHQFNLAPSGHTSIDGRPMNVYAGTGGHGGPTIYYQLYVDASSNLIRRTVTKIPRFNGPQGGSFSVTTTQDFASQKLNPPLSDSLFHFAPPSGAQKGTGGTGTSLLGALGGGTP